MHMLSIFLEGMASPLIGITGVNSLLFASYGISRRIISPFPQLTLPETALAGSMAGVANAILASPGNSIISPSNAPVHMRLDFSGDVQSSYARPVWCKDR